MIRQELEKVLMPPHSSTNFEIQSFYPNEYQSNGAYSRDNLVKVKHGAPLINVDELVDIGSLWVNIHVKNNVTRAVSAKVTYFDCFGVRQFSKEKKLNSKVKKILVQIFTE